MAVPQVISGDLRITLDDDTVYHSTSCSLSMTREFKERETKDTSGIERAKGKKSWTASVEGLATYLNSETDTVDFYEIFDKYNDDTTTPLAIEFVPGESDAAYKLTGEGFIENLENSNPVGEDATISFSIVGTGNLTKTAIV